MSQDPEAVQPAVVQPPEVGRELPGRDILWQEYLPGPEYGLGLIGNPDRGLTVLPPLEAVDPGQTLTGLPLVNADLAGRFLPDFFAPLPAISPPASSTPFRCPSVRPAPATRCATSVSCSATASRC